MVYQGSSIIIFITIAPSKISYMVYTQNIGKDTSLDTDDCSVTHAIVLKLLETLWRIAVITSIWITTPVPVSFKICDILDLGHVVQSAPIDVVCQTRSRQSCRRER